MKPVIFPESRPRGIALLEVLIALTVFALVALGLVRAYTVAMETSRLNDRVAEATTGLQNQMAITLGRTVALGKNDLPEDGSGVTFHLRVEKAGMAGRPPDGFTDLLRISITAHWTENDREYEREIHYLKYQP